MILALVGDDAARRDAAVAFLTARSAEHVDLSDGAAEGDHAARLAQLSEARHYVVTGVATPGELAAVRGVGRFRLVWLGAPPRADGPARALHDEAHARLDGPVDEVLERVRGVAYEAMTGFDRPSWDDYFMDIAHVVARRSNCMKRKVAAVVVRDRRIVTTGYNGTPRGARNCNEGGCPRCNTLAPAGAELEECMCNHAEENAIVQAAFHGISVRGATLYCTYSPCLHCTKLIINAGIEEVVYNAEYPMGARALDLLTECGVRARRYP
jgi:dCMP deaminase